MTDEVVVDVRGTAEGAFAPLRDVFARTIAAQEGGGAALAVVHDGRLVVDLVAGDYRDDTLQLVYSVSKAITAVAVGTAVRDGILDLDAPLALTWPDFAKPATRGVTLRDVMSHRSGLSALREPLTFAQILRGEDQELVGRTEPWWEPGTAHGYHSFTYGSLVDGALRRSIGVSAGELVQRRVAEPLGLDLWIGAPDAAIARVRPTVGTPVHITRHEADRRARGEVIPDPIFATFASLPNGLDSPELLRASLPALSGLADARSLARLMAATDAEVDGVRLLDAATRDDLTRERSYGMDRTLGVVSAFGTGFQLPFPQLPYSGARAYGHEAAGGSYAFCDPELGIGVGYTTDVFPHMHGASIGGVALMSAIRHCAERAGS